MIVSLRILFGLVLASMLGVTTWASLHCPLFGVPREVYTHPWFIATLFDTYWGFLTFYVWVCYKETTWPARVAWFVAIMLLGNIAMAAYCLAILLRAAPGTPPADLLTRRHERTGGLGPALAVAGLAVILLALPRS